MEEGREAGEAISRIKELMRITPEEEVLEEYNYSAAGVPVSIRIVRRPTEYTPSYVISIPLLAEGTKIMLHAMRGELISRVKFDVAELVDPRKATEVRARFERQASELINRHFTGLTPEKTAVLVSYLLQYTLGMGDLEILMADPALEDIAINGPHDFVWVYHKRHGWCKTNFAIRANEVIYEHAAMAGRKVGRTINVLNPVMEATLLTGDRITATLSPISTMGNTIAIRKFAQNPWTIPFLIQNKTISTDVAALIWLCVANEVSLLSSGGAAAGKTSLLNAICCMIPANQRIISIEDTRELTLPEFFQWVPLLTREPNPEGKGGVEMIDLLVTSLRMRPDRIVVGEVRRQREAEVLFEAMHTGHSVYATIHADNAHECITRLISPPINLPKSVLPALGGIVVQFRNRRTGIRRTYEFAEITDTGDAGVIWRWDPKEDVLKQVGEMTRLAAVLGLYTGMTQKEIKEDLAEKARILNWMVAKNYIDVNTVGRIVSDYYKNPSQVEEAARRNKDWI